MREPDSRASCAKVVMREVTHKIPTEASVCEARSRSKPARGAREAGPRGICGGPSAELNSEPSTVPTRA
jgi:hypothetical protein